jgi:hypothetical protein
MNREAWIAVLALSLTACSQGSAQTDAKKLHDQITAAGTQSPACKMFSRAEIAAAFGAAVEDGKTSGPLGSACSWDVKNSSDYESVMVQIVSRDYWEDGTQQPGGEALSGIGEKAFVGPWLGDQRAGALTDKGAVYVLSPKKEVSVALLRKAAERMPTP